MGAALRDGRRREMVPFGRRRQMVPKLYGQNRRWRELSLPRGGKVSRRKPGRMRGRFCTNVTEEPTTRYRFVEAAVFLLSLRWVPGRPLIRPLR